MTNKEYLKQLWSIDDDITTLQEQIEELHQKATSIGSVLPKDIDVVSSVNVSAPFERYFDDLEILWKRLEKKVDEYVQLRYKIAEGISAVSQSRYRTVLTRRYVLRQTWEQIAEQMNADRSTVIRWHGLALLEFKQ